MKNVTIEENSRMDRERSASRRNDKLRRGATPFGFHGRRRWLLVTVLFMMILALTACESGVVLDVSELLTPTPAEASELSLPTPTGSSEEPAPTATGSGEPATPMPTETREPNTPTPALESQPPTPTSAETKAVTPEGSRRHLGDDYRCTGTLDGDMVDDLIVPRDTTCTLNGTYVEGNISVYENATLYAHGVRVDGNIQAEYAARVEVHTDSYVGGNIEFDEGGVLIVSSVMIDGNLEAEENWGEQTYTGNTIQGDLEVEENKGRVAIHNNTIYGDLECEDNSPAPTGSGNTVYGDSEGQCKGW